MLDDRHYMRPDPRSGFSLQLNFSLTVWLMIALGVTFAFQQIDLAYFQGVHLRHLALNSVDLSRGYLWELLTFQFLHGGVMHLLFNLIGIWFFGRFVEGRLGGGHFLRLYFLSGIAGGILQCSLAWIFPYHYSFGVVGASAGVFALIAAFALLEPEAPILMFFVLPIPAKYLLYIESIIALFFTIVPSDPGIAHAAHLGGILFGVWYIKWGMDISHNFAKWNPFHKKMRRERLVKAATAPPMLSVLRRKPRIEDSQELPSEEFISQQVDPILDKISAHGIHSLTDRERQILQAARAKMSKR